jgi:DNA-binding NarL/FixJ family response regulator
MKMIKAFVVEDEIIIRMYLTKALKELGCEIIGESSTGEEAVGLVRNNAPDVIFMDIRLAGKMNGVEAALTIREKMHFPIVFLSAFDAHIPPDMTDIFFADKPIHTFLLEEIISKIRAADVT